MKTKIKENVKKGVKNNNKSGISLIVLVITIIVIIILAATVILTLNNNNPINEANQARYESDVANMQAIFTNVVTKVMAKNQCTIKVNAGELNSVKVAENGVSNAEGRVNYTLDNPENSSNENGTIVFNTGDNNETTYYTGKMLPLYNAGETTWYVDSEGVISLKVGEQEYGKGEKVDKPVENLKEEIPIADSDTPILKARTWSDTSDFYPNYYKKKITKVKFAILDKVPGNRIDEWDISTKRDKSIMAWTQDDGNEGYILTIAGKSKIIANSKSSNMFRDFCNLKEIENIEILDTTQVREMSDMFFGCNSLTNLDLSSFSTSNVTSMSQMFFNCQNLSNLNLSNFDTSNVTNMGAMFNNCGSLTNLNIGSFNTSNVTNMHFMFSGCSNLSKLDLSNFNTNKVIYMYNMFYDCDNLINLDISSFNTDNVTDMESMFRGCKKLTNLDLSNFNTSNVTKMSFMFANCDNLTNLNISSFDTSKVYTMEKMFYNSPKIITTISIKNSGMTNYEWIFVSAATDTMARITINYTTATSTLVDNMIATKSSNSNVVKGTKI